MSRPPKTMATSAAIRSLNADFVRKGIVVSSDDPALQGRPALDPKILQLVEALKGSCKSAGSKDVSDISTAIQHWKEKSLHHTLQTLDEQRGATASVGHERHIQAIELHEKAGREVKEAVLKVVQSIIEAVVRQIDTFTQNLASIIRELLKPELEEELAREQAINRRLIEDKQRLMQERHELQQSAATLQERVTSLENEPDGSGDAILCRKLRRQVKELAQQNEEMRLKMAQLEQDHEQWRYEMAKMKAEMDIQQKTLTITRAMHEKETKQLVNLVHMREDQFQQVKQATAVAIGTTQGTVQQDISSYDVYSGKTIQYKKPTDESPTKRRTSSGPVLACFPPQTASSPTRRTSAPPPISPNKKRMVAASPAKPPPSTNNAEMLIDGDVCGVAPPMSPRGAVRRPFSSSQIKIDPK